MICFGCRTDLSDDKHHYIIDSGSSRSYRLCSNCYTPPSKRNKNEELIKRGYIKSV